MGEEIKTKDELVEDISEEAFASLDLDLEDLAKKQPSEEGGKVESKHKPEDLAEEDEDEDEEEQEQEKVEEVEDEDEEVVSKSKYEKLKERMEKRIDRLTAQTKKLEESKTSQGTRREKLENMSEKELKALKRDAFREAKKTDDPDKEDQYLDLYDEIDEVIREAPKRFESKQIAAYEEAVEEIMLDPKNEDIDFNKEAKAIKEIAANIYNKKPDLRKLVSGQAMAIEFAVEHYRELRKVSKVKSKEATLKRKNTDLKRKTSLDSSKTTGTPKNSSKVKKLFKKAKNSWRHEDKEAFFGEFIGDDAIDDYLK